MNLTQGNQNNLSFYFDYAASAPPFAQVIELYARISQQFCGNPSALHMPGRAASTLLQNCKKQFLELCHAKDKLLILTSGGSEANNLVIRGVMERENKSRLLLTADTHDSAWFAHEYYRKRVDVLYPDAEGSYPVERVAALIKPKTRLLSLPHVCNETGKIHPVAEIAACCRQRNVLLHCDGVQAVGHLDINSAVAASDFYTFSAHKFGGLRGTGGIICSDQNLQPQIAGGRQEGGLRAGSENIAGLAAAGAALQICESTMSAETEKLKDLENLLGDQLKTAKLDFIFNSKPAGLPGLISLAFPGLFGINIVAELDLLGFAVSAGSACHANNTEPSRVILAIGRSKIEALGTIRISLGRHNTREAVLSLADALVESVRRQRLLA